MTRSPSLRRIDVVLNAHLQHAWGRAAVERLDPYISIEREERIFRLVAGCDPTKQGKYLGWLSAWRRRWWECRGLRSCCDMRELDRLASALGEFHQVQSHLPVELRDINQYTAIDELFVIESYLTTVGAGDLRKAQRAAAYADTDILFDHGRWKLVRLRSRAAASWWGMGTRWCTSARTGNSFDLYSLRGPLLVLITPTDRYQLAVATGEFRDAADNIIDLDAVLLSAPIELRQIMAPERERTRNS